MLGEARKNSPRNFQWEGSPAQTLVWDFWPPELLENMFLLFKSPRLCDLLRQPWGTKQMPRAGHSLGSSACRNGGGWATLMAGGTDGRRLRTPFSS